MLSNYINFVIKNFGGDFLIFKFKIKKDKLKDVLFKFSEVIDIDVEKDWYINFNKDKFSLFKI